MAIQQRYYTTDQVVAHFDGLIGKKTLEHWRYNGKGPAYLKVGGKILYPVKELLDWEVRSRSDGGGEAAA